MVEVLTSDWFTVVFRLGVICVLGLLIHNSRQLWPLTIRRHAARQQQCTIEALAVAINAKDNITAAHVRRVQVYAEGVGRLMGCTEEQLRALREGSLLHDVGKIAVPDSILTKRGRLTCEEFEKMKTHTLVGAQILARCEFPFPIVPIVRSHHERWDGTGYPDGLRGEEIPLGARILSVVDCFDAVREDRPYRKGMTRQEAVDLVLEGSGTQYDPEVVGIFLTNLPRFEAQINAERAARPGDYGIPLPEEITGTALLARPAAGVEGGDAAAH